MFDYVIKDGLIIDGLGDKPYVASVYLKDGVIAKITEDSQLEAKNIYNAKGKCVTPGFIDMHSHSDISAFSKTSPVGKLYQGVTTEVVGNCGFSPFPLSELNREDTRKKNAIKISLDNLSSYSDLKNIVNQKGFPNNMICLMGHGALRGSIVGLEAREPTPLELEKMRVLLDEELTNGVKGLSLGLAYAPGSFCKTEELIELAKVVKKHDGILSVHMRSEQYGIFKAVEEVIEITRKSNVHLHISHLKLMGKKNWSRAKELTKIIEDGKAEGLTITCDQYPYTASSTYLSIIMPKLAYSGGVDKLVERLTQGGEEIISHVEQEIEERGGEDGVQIVSTAGRYLEVEGKTLKEIGKELNITSAQAAINIVAKSFGGAMANYFCISPKDMMEIMEKDYITVGSDGTAYSYDLSAHTSSPHPRNFGTFPRFLQIVRETNIMPLEKAIQKITKLPSDILNLTDRGVLKEGYKADITVFSPQEVEDMCTYQNSIVKPKGINAVFIGGKAALIELEEAEEYLGRII